MQKYIMNNEKDYRTAVNGQGHGVVLIKRENEIDIAFGYFKTVDEDMKIVSEQEEADINTSLTPMF